MEAQALSSRRSRRTARISSSRSSRRSCAQACADAGAASPACLHPWRRLLLAVGHVRAAGPIEVLINAKADVDAKMARHGGTALMVAAQNTQLTAARCLLAAKANVEIADEQGWRALQWAAQIGPVEMIQFLLESGATVDAKNDVAGVSSAMMVAVGMAASPRRTLF